MPPAGEVVRVGNAVALLVQNRFVRPAQAWAPSTTFSITRGSGENAAIQRHGVHLGRIGGRQILRGEPGKAHLVRNSTPVGWGTARTSRKAGGRWATGL